MPSFISQNSTVSIDRSWCCRILTCIDSQLMDLFEKPKDKSILIDMNTISESLWRALDVDDETLNAEALHAIGTHILHKPFECHLNCIVRLLEKSQELWSVYQSNFIGIESAWCIGNCLIVLAKIREKAVNGVDGNTLDWNRLIQTCCELCSTVDQSTKVNHEVKRSTKVEIAGKNALTAESESVKTTNNNNNNNSTVDGVIKNPDDHRCENGAKALGYALGVLAPGMIKKQEIINEMVKTLCQALVLDKINGAAKVRWNANYSAGHLFRNRLLWSELIKKHLSIDDTIECEKDIWSVIMHKSIHADTDSQLDPITSSQSILELSDIVKYLCKTITYDRYFKARVRAAKSLYAIYEYSPYDYPNSIIHLFTTIIINKQLTSRTTLTINDLPVIWIIEACIHTLINTQCTLQKAYSITHDLCPSTTITMKSSTPLQHHLTENNYRDQSVVMSVILLFQSLYYLLVLIKDLSISSNSEARFCAEMICAQLENLFNLSDLNNPVVIEQINNLIEISLQSTDEYLKCIQTIFFDEISMKSSTSQHNVNDAYYNYYNSINRTIANVVNLFNEYNKCETTVFMELRGLMKFLSSCSSVNSYSTEGLQSAVDEKYLEGRRRKSKQSDASGFRQVYD
ncbi:unnamed protein product [Trichobilharzia szidati]|nr:unnamed protein product [Trichobilharzia szidati]